MVRRTDPHFQGISSFYVHVFTNLKIITSMLIIHYIAKILKLSQALEL